MKIGRGVLVVVECVKVRIGIELGVGGSPEVVVGNGGEAVEVKT